MSRVGKLPVSVPDSIEVQVSGDTISFKSAKSEKTYQVSPGVLVNVEDQKIKLTSSDKAPSNISMFIGMDRSNINNIVAGLVQDFKVKLEVNGVGYKVAVEGKKLVLTLGYSHEIFYMLPSAVSAVFEKPNFLVLSSDNKVLVGQVASEIISFRKPEPYKGKGVKVFGQKILRKEGKKK